MKSRKAKRARSIRIPSVKAIRQGAASFFRVARATGKKAVRSIRRMTRRLTCRRR